MKRMVLSFMIALATGVAAGQEAARVTYRFTLEDCLDYAFGNSYHFQSVKLTEEARGDALEQSRQERFPGLNASVSESLGQTKGASASWSGSYGVSASMTLYQGGNVSNTIEQNRLRKEQSVFQTSQYRNNLTIQVLQAVLAVLGNEELLKYQESVVKAGEEQVRQGEERFRHGEILESDYLLLEAQQANDQGNVLNTRIARDNSLLALKGLLSMPVADDLQVISPDTTAVRRMGILPAVEEVLQQTVQTLPDLKISQSNIDIARVSLKTSRAGYLPTLNLHGSAGTGHADYARFGTQLSDRLNHQVGLTLGIPIYDNGRTRSKVTQGRIALQQAELDRKQAELDVQQTVVADYQSVVSAYSKYQTTRVRENAYSKTFDVYRARFNAGAITAVDLLQQQNNYISALNDYIQSKYEFILKRKILDVYMGFQVTM